MSEQEVIEVTEANPAKRKTKRKLRGSHHVDFQDALSLQVFRSLSMDVDDEQFSKDYGAAMRALEAFEPQNEVEAMMAGQMVSLHNMMMECIRRAMFSNQTFEGRNMNLNQANKLSRTYAVLLDAFNKHRGKGQQKITVEHVTVAEGGQAVIGNVDAKGRGK